MRAVSRPSNRFSAGMRRQQRESLQELRPGTSYKLLSILTLLAILERRQNTLSSITNVKPANIPEGLFLLPSCIYPQHFLLRYRGSRRSHSSLDARFFCCDRLNEAFTVRRITRCLCCYLS